MSDCGRETCWCCGRGHDCEPPEYPTGGGQEWTCPECARRYLSFLVNDDPRTSDRIKKFLTGPTWGWRSLPPRAAEKAEEGRR